MSQRRIGLAALVVMVLFAIMAVPAAAQQEGPGQLVVGGRYTLATGQRLDGDLGVIGGSATIEEGATVNGDVMVAGGALTVAGRVNGNVAVFGGVVTLAPTAHVTGDLASFGGAVRRSPGAVVGGETVEPGRFQMPFAPGSWFMPGRQSVEPGDTGFVQPGPGHWLLTSLWRALRVGIVALALAALAMLVALFWPRGIETLGQTIMRQPAAVLLVGLLSWIVGIGLSIVLAITLCLLPVALALGLALLAAALLSWAVAGWLVGRTLLAALKVRPAAVVVEAVVGTLLLALIYFLVGSLPCTEFIFGALVVSLGLGAIVLTRLGTRPYPFVPAAGASGPPAVVGASGPPAGGPNE